MQLCPQWIPRSENEQADILSKYVDKDDWKLHPNIFNYLNNLWGPHTVDRLASHYNNQINRSNSRFASPGCEAVDALPQNWSYENNWVCPPAEMIATAIRHFSSCNAGRTLVIPEWKSAYFWPLIRPSPTSFATSIVGYEFLSNIPNMLIPGPGQLKVYKAHKSAFHGCPKFNMMALRVKF